MNVFGKLEMLLARLYPYRVPLALVALALLATAAAFAWRRGWIAGVRRFAVGRPRRALAAGVVTAAVALPLGFYLLSPLFVRSTLVEVSPSAVVAVATAAPATDTTTTTPERTRTVLRGEWRGADEFHFARGQALIIETAPGRYALRVEQFSVRNGPDLFVYVSPSASGYAAGAINLGALKATDGAFNYDVPAGTTLDQLGSAVVWCRQFTVQFGHAVLRP